ncbi:MAG: four helix bundle protein [Patescibacteria group bacterium]
MTLSSHSDPYGYKKLLVYKKAEELQSECARLTAHFPPFAHSSRFKTLAALADQMDRSARSVKQNIVEGWKRNSTKEYYEFLGFSLGANAELEEDCNDIIKGVYAEMGLKGMEKGDGKEEKGERGTPSTPSPHFPLFTLDEVERLPFYPLNSRLPPLVRLKLRCKELNMLLQKLQSSLADKMSSEHRTPLVDRQNAALKRERENDAWIEREREKWEKGGK